MTDANLIIRPEMPADRATVATLIARTYLAEGAATIALTGQLRSQPTYQPDLALVAEQAGQPAAFALFTPVTVGETPRAALLLAPFAYDPARADAGGNTFLTALVDAAAGHGARYILMFGAPADYAELGFAPADTLGITCSLKLDAGVRLLVRDLGEAAGPAASGEVIIPELLR